MVSSRFFIASALTVALTAVGACGRIGFGETQDGLGFGGTAGAESTSAGDSTTGGSSGDGECVSDCELVTSSLVLLYEFDQGVDDLVAYDTSDYGDPLNLHLSAGEMSWGGEGLTLSGPARLTSRAPAKKVKSALLQSEALSLEAWFTPRSSLQFGPGRIFAISKDLYERNLTLAQEGATLRVRLRTDGGATDPGGDGNGAPSLVSAPILTATRTHVVYLRESDGDEQLYLNGRLLSSGYRPGGFSEWDDNYLAGVGAEIEGVVTERDWQGDLEHVAVYNRALSPAEIEQNFRAGGGEPEASCGADCSERYAAALDYQNFEGEASHVEDEANVGSIEVVQGKSHSGSSSLLITQGPELSSTEVQINFPPTSTDPLFFRGWVYLPSGSVTGLMKLVGFHQDRASSIDLNVLADGRVGIFSHATGIYTWSSQGTVPSGQWFCLQASVLPQTMNGSATVAVDGTSQVVVEGVSTFPIGGLNRVAYGMPWSENGQSGGSVYWDDVVLDTSPVPCD